jgi:hypothetical protein
LNYGIKSITKLDVSVEPLFNRAVIFTITSESLHGHPVPLNTPENVSRNSIALYYFTEVNPYKDDDEPFGCSSMIQKINYGT